MGRVRAALAGVLDGVIGGLSSLRDRVESGSGSPDGAGSTPTDRPETDEDPDVTERPDPDGGDRDGDLPTPDDGGAVPDTTDDGVTGAVRGKVGADLAFGKTALRHPVTAYRTHVESLAGTPTLSTDFVKELWVVGEDVKRRRAERIHEHVQSDRTLRDDTRAAVEEVDWSRTWQYGKYGFLAGRRYSKRIPVADRYAPVAGAVAGGAFGAVTGATDRTLVDVDPDRLFDRIDAISRIREDPVTRARVARETVRAVERRVGDDDVPVEEVLDDEDIGRLVTRADEATPTNIPSTGPGPSAARIEELITGDPLPDPDRPLGLPASGDRSDTVNLPTEGPGVDPDGRGTEVVDADGDATPDHDDPAKPARERDTDEDDDSSSAPGELATE